MQIKAKGAGLPISIHALRVEGDGTGRHYQRFYEISIHALRVEGDHQGLCWLYHHGNFYPRPPGGGRLCYAGGGRKDEQISIHALRVEGDR